MDLSSSSSSVCLQPPVTDDQTTKCRPICSGSLLWLKRTMTLFLTPNSFTSFTSDTSSRGNGNRGLTDRLQWGGIDSHPVPDSSSLFKDSTENFINCNFSVKPSSSLLPVNIKDYMDCDLFISSTCMDCVIFTVILSSFMLPPSLQSSASPPAPLLPACCDVELQVVQLHRVPSSHHLVSRHSNSTMDLRAVFFLLYLYSINIFFYLDFFLLILVWNNVIAWQFSCDSPRSYSDRTIVFLTAKYSKGIKRKNKGKEWRERKRERERGEIGNFLLIVMSPKLLGG